MEIIKSVIEFAVLIGTFSGIVLGGVKYLLKPIRISMCKDYLVDFLAEVELGIPKDLTQITRAFEKYDIYTNELKQNSYIHTRWEEVMGNVKLNDFVKEFANSKVQTLDIREVVSKE